MTLGTLSALVLHVLKLDNLGFPRDLRAFKVKYVFISLPLSLLVHPKGIKSPLCCSGM